MGGGAFLAFSNRVYLYQIWNEEYRSVSEEEIVACTFFHIVPCVYFVSAFHIKTSATSMILIEFTSEYFWQLNSLLSYVYPSP